jgi:copper chaperone CopZ
MKNIFKTLVITTILLISNATIAQISKAEIRATGLTCSMCSNAINKQLKSLPEVTNVETDLNTNTFTVTLTEGNSLSPKVFKESVEKAGFFIGELKITINNQIINKAPYIATSELSSSSSEVIIQILDKGYVTDKEFKKLSKKMKDISSYASNNEEDFHFIVIN